MPMVSHWQNDEDDSLISAHTEHLSTRYSGHFEKLGALWGSAASGCHLCMLLKSDRKIPTPENTYCVNLVLDRNNAGTVGDLFVESKSYTSAKIPLYNGQALTMCGPTRMYSHTSNPNVLRLASDWLKTCLQTHARCRTCVQPSRKAPFVPTRLIQIECRNERLHSIRLVCGIARPPASSGYLALSHRWGKADILRLMQKTLKSFQDNIPLAELPKTFADALDITISLGYKHLWIDSLCVVQDCAEDWSQEAQLMGDVYQGSVCTIAALAAKDSHDGCFTKRDVQRPLPCQLYDETSDTQALYANKSYSGDYPKPLLSRAWVLQERLLSLRTISFGADQIMWECVEAKASEELPSMQPLPITYSGTILKRDFYDMLAKPPLEEPLESTMAHRRYNWSSLISAYTKCNLTFQEDKWRAIQGLATHVSRAWEDKLIYGLWESDLVEDLLWNVTGRLTKRPSMEFPSWSWLSVGSEVKNIQRPHFTDPKTCAIIEKWSAPANPTTSHPNPTRMNLRDQPQVEITACLVSLRSDRFRLVQDDWYNCHLGDTQDGLQKTWNGKWNPDTKLKEMWDTYAVHVISYSPVFHAGIVVCPIRADRSLWKRVGYFECYEDASRVWNCESDGHVHVGNEMHGIKATITLL
jgi:hypothetical protein